MKKKSLNEIKLSKNVKDALRLINNKLISQQKAMTYSEPLEMTGAMMDFIDSLNKQEKESLVKVIKALTLLTSGNVKSVRSAGRSFKKAKSQSWSRVLSGISDELLTYIGFNTSQKVTQRDYTDAAAYLRSLTSQRNYETDPAEKFGLMFRGMSDIDKNTLIYLLSNDEIFISKGSSFSTDLTESYKFAQ